jgi:hypothetical protein
MSLARESIEECIIPEMKNQWDMIRRHDHRADFKADGKHNFSHRKCCPKHINHDKREPGLYQEEWRGDEMNALCSKTYCGVNLTTGDAKLSRKGLNKNNIIEPVAKFRKVMETKENESSTNRGLRCVNNSMVTYTLQKKGLAYFYPTRKVMADGIRTEQLDL